MKLTHAILPCETMLLIFLAFATFFDIEYLSMFKFCVFFSVGILKRLKEGFRVLSLLYFAGTITIDLFPFTFRLLILGVSTLAYIYYPVYRYPKPSGQYLVGHRNIQHEGRNVSIFYPTDMITKDSMFMPKNIHYWKFWAEGKKFAGIEPNKTWLEFKLSYLDFVPLGVQSNSPLVKGKSFPVIIFSHGLASHRNACSLFCKEWASNGYLVFSVDHTDIICPENRAFEDFETRNRDLERRIQDVSLILDLIYSKDTKWKEIIGVSNLHEEIDFNKISAAGHSYGGATALSLAMRDKRITGPCVLMDPWMFPIDKKDYRPVKVPILIIRALDFEFFSPKNKSLVSEFVKMNRMVDQRIACGYLKGSTHASFTDFSLFMGRELVKLKSIGSFANISEYYEKHGRLIKDFLRISNNAMINDSEFSIKLKEKFESSGKDDETALIIEHTD